MNDNQDQPMSDETTVEWHSTGSSGAQITLDGNSLVIRVPFASGEAAHATLRRIIADMADGDRSICVRFFGEMMSL